MIVTIDGPAGAGKSTVARALAARLGFEFLDTGAMYRAVALAGMRARVSFADQEQVNQLLDGLRLEMSPGRTVLNGEDVSSEIRTPPVTQLSRSAADHPAVRRHLGELQRRFAQGKDLVTEGRDQGTVVFPDADCKFFLVARPEERARRRYEELIARGQSVSFDEVLEAQTERDQRDQERSLAPMVPAPDAITCDSTGLTISAIVDWMETHVRARSGSGGTAGS